MKIGVPAYSWNLTTWPTLLSQPKKPNYLIVPDLIGSGNTGGTNSAYAAQITAAVGAGVKVLGYISTAYGSKPVGQVESEIDRWYAYYPNISGIFFDEGGPATGDPCSSVQGYYTSVVAYARSAGATYTVLNPGGQFNVSCLDGVADGICTFEGLPTTYGSYVPDAWQANAVSEIWHLVYGASGLGGLFTQAASLGADVFFATDDAPPNPWDGAPTYWAEEAALGSGAVPSTSVIASSLTVNANSNALGATVNYVLRLTNTGGVAGTASVSLAVPGLTNVTWSGTGFSPSSGTGPTISVTATVPAQSIVTLTATGVANTPGTFTTNATVNGVNTNTTSLIITGTSATLIDVVSTLTPVSSVGAPNTVVEYLWTIQNNGPGNAVNIPISNGVPAFVGSKTWSVVSGLGSFSGAPSGSGALNGSVNINAGQSIAFRLLDTIVQDVPSNIVQITESATVTIPSSYIDSNASNNVPVQANIALNNTSSINTSLTAIPVTVYPGTVAAGEAIIENTYDRTVSVAVAIGKPKSLSSWSWDSSVLEGVVSGNVSSGQGNIDNVIVMGPGAKIAYNYSGIVKSVGYGPNVITQLQVLPNYGVAPEGKQVIVPILSPTGSPTVTDEVTGTDKTAVWTITLENHNSFILENIRVVNPVVAGVSSWSYTGSATGSVTGLTASGTSSVTDVLTLSPGSKVVYVLRAGFNSGSVFTNSFHYSDSSSVEQPTVETVYNVGKTVTLDLIVTTSDVIVTAGGQVRWTIVAENKGSNTVTGVRLNSLLPVGVCARTYTVVGTNVSGFPQSASGPIGHTLSFLSGGKVTYSIVDTVCPTSSGDVFNSVSIQPPSGMSNTLANVAKSLNVLVLSAAGTKVIDAKQLLSSYENLKNTDAYISFKIIRPVKICSDTNNRFIVSMDLEVVLDGVSQDVLSDNPSFEFNNVVGPQCVSGSLVWEESFVVPFGRKIQIYGSTVLSMPDGVYKSSFNSVELGSGIIIVEE